MPIQKTNKTKEIIDKIFKDPNVTYGLKEFENIEIEKVLKITEKERGKFSIKDFCGGNDRVVWNEEKQKGVF